MLIFHSFWAPASFDYDIIRSCDLEIYQNKINKKKDEVDLNSLTVFDKLKTKALVGHLSCMARYLAIMLPLSL